MVLLLSPNFVFNFVFDVAAVSCHILDCKSHFRQGINFKALVFPTCRRA